MEIVHKPVLPDEVLEFLAPQRGGQFIDGTLGQGGHAELILLAAPTTEVLGIDRDAGAIETTKARLGRFGERIHCRRGDYPQMREFAKEIGWKAVDGILLDIGFGSHQLDDAARGFSFRHDGPLDMRMDRRQPVTAASLLNHESPETLIRILREYGEEKQARRIVEAITERRQQQPWSRTGELAGLIREVVGNPRYEVAVLARCFQALRIAVNDELGQLRRGLEAAHGLLKPGGRLVVICFHSLEDRIVKQFLREKATGCICPPRMPQCACGHKATLRLLSRKVVRPDEEETEDNSRAACAKLRAAEKC
jgi:16S rRNA (cytosine1402-N4)-methyltransferase